MTSRRHIVPCLLTLLLLLPTYSTKSLAQEQATRDQYGSVEERRLRNSIQASQANIRKEREEIALKEKELKTMEEGVDKKLAEIDTKLSELRALQEKIKTLLTEKSVEEKKQLEGLAKIYEKMTPAKAALALSGLEKQLAADLLKNMRVKSAAKILDQISKQKVTELSTTYSTIQIE